MAMGRCRRIAWAAATGWRGSRRFPARTLPVPPGRSPRGIPVPAIAPAICIAVPSPPYDSTASNPSSRPRSASRRASPAAAVTASSTLHPPPCNTSRTAPMARASVRAAAGLLIRSARVTSVPPLPEQIDAHLPLQDVEGRAATALTHRLHARFRAPFRAEAELQARADGVSRRAGTHPRPHDEEGSRADLLAERERRPHERVVGITGADLYVVERDPQIGHHAALDFA